MALGRIGALRINDYGDNAEDSTQAIQARLHFEQTRDALARSHLWRCNRARATLSANTVDPDFGYDYAYDLPSDFLRLVSIFNDNDDGKDVTWYTNAIEGNQILSNEDTMEILYNKQVTDPTVFDPLFIEVLVLQLALKFVMPLSQDKVLRREIYEELWGTPRQPGLMSKVRALDKSEQRLLGRANTNRWIDNISAGCDPARSCT
jgi:hypothetical protein